MTDLAVASASTSTDPGDSLDHIACARHAPDRAICGADVSGADWAWIAAPALLCVVCADLDAGDGTCPYTGRPCDCPD